MPAMGVVVGLLLFVVALWWLRRLKQRDLAEVCAVLGLEPAPFQSTRGTSPEGFACVDHRLLHGTVSGHPAVLVSRGVRHPRASRLRRTGSEFTLLELTLPRAVATTLRVQPSGLLDVLEGALRGGADDRVPIEPAFDEAYVVHSDRPEAARTALNGPLQARLLAFRTAVAGSLPASLPGAMASGLQLGTFHVDGAVARYVVFGSPTRATAEHAKAAVPLLLALAEACR